MTRADRPREFIALVTCMIGMSALGIDLMLPTFPDIRHEFGMAPDSAKVGWIITAYFLGLAIGPWLYGPASDRLGRRKPLFAGLIVYIVGAALSALAPSFGLLIAARVLWGLGSAAPRSISLALVRDRFEGDEMARVMSLTMGIFLIVPVIAPSIGAGLNSFAPWRIVFWLPTVAGVALLVWTVRRLPETLVEEKRRPFTPSAVWSAARAVASHRQTVCFTIAMSFLFGVMTAYLASSELIVRDVYGYGRWFPEFFGAIGILFALNSLNNARVVQRVGLTALIRRSAFGVVVGSAVLAAVALIDGGHPNFWLFTIVLALTIPLNQGLIPPSNTAAMLPVAHIAGTASALIGTVTTAGGALLGNVVADRFNGSVQPFAFGMLAFVGIASCLILFGATARQRVGSVAASDFIPEIADGLV